MKGRSPGSDATYEDSEVARRYARRNFSLGIVNGTLFVSGYAFSAPTTVLPVFVSIFTKSSLLIGLTGTLTSVGWLLPQLAVARYAEHLPTKLRLYGMAAVFRLLAWFALAISVLWADDLSPGTYLLVFFACLAGFSLTGGASGLAFLDIVGKTIPPERRGRYFGYRRFFSGVISAFAGIVVAYVLGNPDRFPFPSNYFILFTLTFVFIFSAIGFFMFTKEPSGSVKEEREASSGEYLTGVRKVVREDRNFRNFLIVMVLSHASALSTPFYVIYATAVLGAPVSWVGWYVTIETVAILISNLAWGYVGDSYGYRTMIRVCTVLSMAAPLLAIVSPDFYVLSLVFALKGAGSSGLWLSKNNYALEIAPVTRRPTYMGLLNTSLAFVMLLPVVGGIIVDLGSYWMLFSVTGLVVLASVLRAAGLEEPRRSNHP